MQLSITTCVNKMGLIGVPSGEEAVLLMSFARVSDKFLIAFSLWMSTTNRIIVLILCINNVSNSPK